MHDSCKSGDDSLQGTTGYDWEMRTCKSYDMCVGGSFYANKDPKDFLQGASGCAQCGCTSGKRFIYKKIYKNFGKIPHQNVKMLNT